MWFVKTGLLGTFPVALPVNAASHANFNHHCLGQFN